MGEFKAAPGLEAVTKAFGLTIQNSEAETNGVDNVNGDSERTNGDFTIADGDTEAANGTSAAVNGESKAVNGVPEATNGEAPMQGKAQMNKGSISTIHNIYRSAKDDDGEWTWVDEYPKDVKEAAENEETEKFALIVRNQKSKDSRKKLEAHSIVIQSPSLRNVLGEILEDYPGVSCELQRLIFEAPFAPFIHRWAAFLKYMKRTDLDKLTREHLNLLYDVLQYEIGDTIKEFEDYVLNGVITFDSLWMIFQPGGVVVSAHKGPLSAFELVNSEYVKLQCGVFLRLDCDCVEWDGEDFGRYTEEIYVASFSGTKKIVSLNAKPLPFFEGKEQLKVNLIERGRKFEELAGRHYKA